jgi:hypothetical protein
MSTRLWRLVAPTFVVASVGAVPMSLAHASTRGATADDVRVAVVIDFGARSGVSPRIVIKCLKVHRGTNGSDVLASVASSWQVPAPTYATSGLLCSINGYPSTGCGTSVPGGYAYWSYWHGGGQHWAYANVGPAEWTVRNGDVEGWRYQDPGAVNPAPAASPDLATACAAAATSPAPTPARDRSTAGSATLFAAALLVVVVLGGAGAITWRRRLRT